MSCHAGLAELLDAVRSALRGYGMACKSEQAPEGRLLDSRATSALSVREREVFELIAEGLGTREIAERLGRSVKTVETHREHLKIKLGARSGTELTRLALLWSLSPSVAETSL